MSVEIFMAFTAYLQFVISFVHGPLFYEGEQLSAGWICNVRNPISTGPGAEPHQLPAPDHPGTKRSLQPAALITYSLPFLINNLTYISDSLIIAPPFH